MKSETFLLTGTNLEQKKPEPPVHKRPVESSSDDESQFDDGWVLFLQ
jgi:hypothetical protein